jgi:diadenosine tetraphosphatase ApaH/serine/threonine PP2A family protein phosphatase
MRVLIFSDVHANWQALTALAAYVNALAPEAACGASACLGDVVGYGANPNEVCAWVRTQTNVVIRGNHDRAAAALQGVEWFSPVAAAALRWTNDHLGSESSAWLNALPAGPLVWNGLGLVHGSPLDEDDYLLSSRDAARVFAATRADAACQWFGHTHRQGGFCMDGNRAVEVRGAQRPDRGQAGVMRLDLRPGVRYLLNPGSVGQPRDGDWRAAFAIMDLEAARVEFHRVPYDVAAAQAAIRGAGLPPRLAERLAVGQ